MRARQTLFYVAAAETGALRTASLRLRLEAAISLITRSTDQLKPLSRPSPKSILGRGDGGSNRVQVNFVLAREAASSLIWPHMKQKAYARAGVDIDLGNKVKATLPQLLAATRRPEVLGKVGGFGGLFALDTRKFREPILVSSVDGVGTKLKIA